MKKTKKKVIKRTSKKAKEAKTWVPPADIDEECIDICTAINRLPGLFTIESCCGHGETPYWIWFRLRDDTPAGLMEGLPALLFWMAHFGEDCHDSEWQVFVDTDCAGLDATFRLEGPVGERGVQESKEIAKCLQELMEELSKENTQSKLS